MRPQEQVIQILFEHDRSKSWLAKKLGISKSELGYQLNDAVNYSAALHDRIMAVFRKENFVTDGSQQCAFLINQTLQIDSIIANSITMLNGAVQKYTSDNELSFEEKSNLYSLIDEIKAKTEDAFESAKKIIAGKAPSCTRM